VLLRGTRAQARERVLPELEALVASLEPTASGGRP
jgi:hypothetical protein